MKNQTTSYPREKIRILLLENVSESATAEFAAGGYAGVTRLSGALDEDELAAAVRGVHLLGIRSKTRVTGRAPTAGTARPPRRRYPTCGPSGVPWWNSMRGRSPSIRQSELRRLRMPSASSV